MSETKHTPGQKPKSWWVFVPEVDRFSPDTGHYTSPGHPLVCFDADDPVHSYAEFVGHKAEERATLAARAPDMDAALREAVEAMDVCGDYFDNRADADCDQDGYVPNDEMRVLTIVRITLARCRAALGEG